MKHERIFKTLSALPSRDEPVIHPIPGPPNPPPSAGRETLRQQDISAEDIREMIHQRLVARLDLAATHRNWGINE